MPPLLATSDLVMEGVEMLQARKDAEIIIYGYVAREMRCSQRAHLKPRYRPSKVLAVLAVVVFLLLFLVHLLQVIRYRTKFFIPVSIGLAFEVVGYVARALSAFKNPYTVEYFVIQYFFIVVAPVFFSASIYAIISVLIGRVGRECSPLPPKLILWIFITCDVVATIIQVAGAAMVGVAYSNDKDPTTPNHILLGGLAFQALTFFIFLVLLSIVLFRARGTIISSRSFTIFNAAVVMASLLVYVRTCFRLAETAQGLMATLSRNEAYFGALEFAPIVLALALLSIWHPGQYLTPRGVPQIRSGVEEVRSHSPAIKY